MKYIDLRLHEFYVFKKYTLLCGIAAHQRQEQDFLAHDAENFEPGRRGAAT